MLKIAATKYQLHHGSFLELFENLKSKDEVKLL